MARSGWEWPRPELGPGNRVRTFVYEFRPLLGRVFCEGMDEVRLHGVLLDNRYGSLLPKIRTRSVPTARPGVTCVEFPDALDRLSVWPRDQGWMRSFLRKNRVPGRVRLSGGDEWEAI